MKKKLSLLILSLLTVTVSYSQTLLPKILSDSTVIISNKQLRTSNKLFIQGVMYKEIVNEDSIRIDNYKKLITNYEKIDSLRVNNIDNIQKKYKTATTFNKILSILCGVLAITLIVK